MLDECTGSLVGLSLTSIALVMSVSLNIVLYLLRRKDRRNKEVGLPLYQDSFHSDRFEEEEHQNQDNPIYGNIFVDSGGPGPVSMTYSDYEEMKGKSTKKNEKSDPEDVSYASLDLRLVQKRKKKKRYQEQQNHTHKVQTHNHSTMQPIHMETAVDCDIELPSRTNSLMVSRSSIYLNSHQVALETEELYRQREREEETETEWKSDHE